jgi:hypothetical protein
LRKKCAAAWKKNHRILDEEIEQAGLPAQKPRLRSFVMPKEPKDVPVKDPPVMDPQPYRDPSPS